MKPNKQTSSKLGLKTLAENADDTEILWQELITQTSQSRCQDNAEEITIIIMEDRLR